MDETFNKLFANATKKQQKNYGNPWDVIPIKNKKYSFACEEIHLANQKLQGLIKFEDFPNVEVLWINDNKFEKIENLDNNFRIKCLYAFNNKIQTLEGSLKFFKHIEVLLLNNNELRNLDLNLVILKNLTHLKNLNLFGNPLAEEPNYRLRIIAALPWVELLDQHWITVDERRDSALWVQSELQTEQVKKEKKIQNKQKNFSQAEKDLYENASKIKKAMKENELEQQRLYLESIKPKEYENVLPKPTIVWEVQTNLNDKSKFVTEWEKNRLRNTFKAYDQQKKGLINKDLNLQNVFKDLQEDLQMIGKVPDCTYTEFSSLLQADKDGNIHWDTFRFILNKFLWKKQEDYKIQSRIDNKFLEAHRAKNRGNKNLAFQNIFEAVRMQNAQNLDEMKLQSRRQKIEEKTRKDFIDLGTFKYRNTFALQNEKIFL